MKTIKEELKTCIENIKNNYGVAIGNIDVKWVDVSHMREKDFTINCVSISNCSIINPKGENV